MAEAHDIGIAIPNVVEILHIGSSIASIAGRSVGERQAVCDNNLKCGADLLGQKPGRPIL
jgi:hypothetical protein